MGSRPLVRELATGAFMAEQRNAVLVGGTGKSKKHLVSRLSGQISVVVTTNLALASAPPAQIERDRKMDRDRR